jgi:hypothetical protein
MRNLILIPALVTVGGCESGLLEPGEWGRLRYFGELTGVPTVRGTDDTQDIPLALIPPVSDRQGNVYVLYEDPDGDSVVYVGNARKGWSPGCQAYENDLPHDSADTTNIHGFLGTSEETAWFWAGDALVEVSGKTGQCHQILDTDPLTVTDLRVVAAVPYIHDTPARRTMTAWVQGVNDAYVRNPPFQVVVDLDLGRYVAYSEFQPSDASCLDILGVGSNAVTQEGAIVVAYNRDGERHVEARIINTSGNTTNVIPLTIDDSDFYLCEVDDTEPSEPKVLGQLQSNDAGVYAGLLDNGQLLAFNPSGGSSRDLPDFDAQGLVQFNGELWVSGVAQDKPVVGRIQTSGNVEEVRQWTASERAAFNLIGTVEILDQRYQPSEPDTWKNPVTAIGSWPFISPYPLDVYAIETTGWLVAGPSFESTMTQTAVAFGPVGVTVP